MIEDNSVIFDSHDEFFRSPAGAIKTGEELTLKIFVSRALEAYGVTLRLWNDSSEKLLNMTKCGYFDHTPYGNFLDLYSINISRETVGLVWYQFIVNTPSRPIYACNGEDALGGRASVEYHFNPKRSFQITVYHKDFSVPEWAKGGIMYQIFPDRFYRAAGGGCAENKIMHEAWEDEPDWRIDEALGYYPANDFFGGNLKGITEKLDYIKALGVTCIYLNPIFEAYSNHRYDTGDYEKIDSLLGTVEDFTTLCEEAKMRNIRIIIDGVFSHTGSNSKYFNKNGEYSSIGAYQSQGSEYYQWYSFKSFPNDYESWWGVWSLPCVNELCPSYLNYIVKNENSIVKRWIKAGASGWRLDVADELPDEFIRQLRTSLKDTSADAFLLGEVWEDASNKISYSTEREFLYGSELDSIMNYPLRNAVFELLSGKIDGELFAKKALSLRENYPSDTLYSSMNFLSTHDLERITTKLCGIEENVSRETSARFIPDKQTLIKAKALHKLAALIIYSLPGQPCIYYGDEAGLTGGKDPFNRKTYPWGREDTELLNLYRELGKIHDCEPFRRGSLKMQAAGSLLSIRRKSEKEYRYTLVNYSDETVETLLDESYFKASPQIIYKIGDGIQFSEREGGYYILMPPYSGMILAVNA